MSVGDERQRVNTGRGNNMLYPEGLLNNAATDVIEPSLIMRSRLRTKM